MPYAPLIGGNTDTAFPLQFPKAYLNRYSMSVVLIEHLSNDGLDSVISHGTGFLWRCNGEAWLVSARHVFSGTFPFDEGVMSPDGYIPRRIRIYPGFAKGEETGRLVAIVSLVHDDGGRLWVQDPSFDELRTDIAALRLQIDPNTVTCLNDDENWGKHSDLFTYVGFNCSVVGYPTRHVGGLMTPIWRAGSLASEPRLPIDGKPMFLVDAATGPGFSGSPVFQTQIGPAPFFDATQPTGIRVEVDAVLRTNFIGVYAGRLSHPHFGGEVPYVFYGNRVPMIVESGT